MSDQTKLRMNANDPVPFALIAIAAIGAIVAIAGLFYLSMM